jgi:hypothetical protein
MREIQTEESRDCLLAEDKEESDRIKRHPDFQTMHRMKIMFMILTFSCIWLPFLLSSFDRELNVEFFYAEWYRLLFANVDSISYSGFWTFLYQKIETLFV